MNRRTANNYTEDKVVLFINHVKLAIFRGEKSKMSFSEICKHYGFGQITLSALKNCGFIQVNGRGFKNWKWKLEHPIYADDVIDFIEEIERQKAEHGKKYRPALSDPAPEQKNVLKFKPSPAVKAVQAELPMHPVRLTVLNGIRTELNEIRLRLERIEDRIDQETTKKATGR